MNLNIQHKRVVESRAKREFATKYIREHASESSKDIAAALGVSESFVGKLRSELGLNLGFPYESWLDKHESELRKLKRSGKTRAELATHFALPEPTIKSLLRRIGMAK
jgi:DNA-binding CsgD family transcriptional regulator